MKSLLLNILKYLIGAGLGVFLLWLAFLGVDIDALKKELATAEYIWIIYTVPVALFSHLFRALRWNMLLEASGYKPSALRTYSSLLVGYLVNQGIPRGGEVARCTMLYRSAKVPLSVSMGTVLTERIFDVIVLLVLVAFFVLMETERLFSFFHSTWEHTGGKLGGMGVGMMILIALVPIAGIIGFIFFWRRLRQGPLFSRIANFVGQMMNGAKSIFRLKNPILFVIWTIAIWACYGIMCYMCFFCLEASSGFSLYFGFLLMVMGGIGMALPSPGGIGPYHAAVKYTVVAFFAASLGTEVAENLGITLATIMHTSQLVLMIIAGFFAWLYLILTAPVDSVSEKPA